MKATSTVTKTLILTLVSLASGSWSMATTNSPDIVGGTVVQAGDPTAKSTVAIYLEDSKGSGALCTGSLLNSNTLVTAAHCVKGVARAVVIFARNVNDFQKIPKSQIRQVTAAQANPNFDLKLGEDVNDIAVVQFSGGIPEGYAPATLMNAKALDAALVNGAQVIIAGYGITSMEAQKSSGILRKTLMLVKGTSNAKAEVLLVNPGHSACEGDSGGPAFIQVQGKLYLWGVTSRGDKACSMSIYTKIQAYLKAANLAN